MALVAFQCAVNYLYALIMGHTVLKQGEDTTKSSFYACASLTYLLAMVTSNKALSWVNYPTQVIGKSCKPIPVMVLGVLVGGKKYPTLKYIFILMIVAGVALFMYKDSAAQKAGSGDGLLGVGELLLLVSLTCDGLTGAVQERMKAEHGTKSGHMMMAMNKWSIGYLLVGLLITGEGVEFIFMTVSDFGPLPCSIITTTRKFFTVLASVIFFGNSLVTRQWIGTVFVFAGIFLDGLYGKQKAPDAKTSKD